MTTKKEIINLIEGFRLLKQTGKSDDYILEIIQSLELPLSVHLFITGNFSALMNRTHKIYNN